MSYAISASSFPNAGRNRPRPRRRPSPSVVTIVGDQDASTALSLEQILAPALASGRALVIDLTAVDFMDASTVRVLLMAERSLATHGQRVRVRGARPGPRRVLHLCGLDRLLTERR